MQNPLVAHDTPANPEGSMPTGFDHRPRAEVSVLPFASTATQNDALAHEIDVGEPEGSIEVDFDQDPLLL